MKLLPCFLFEKCIYILALETVSPKNQHCASCIGTLSFPINATAILIPQSTHSVDSTKGLKIISHRLAHSSCWKSNLLTCIFGWSNFNNFLTPPKCQCCTVVYQPGRANTGDNLSPTYTDNVALPAFSNRTHTAAAAIDRYLLPAGPTAANL